MPRSTAKGRLHAHKRSEWETRIASRSMENRSPRSRVADSWLRRSLGRERMILAASVGAHGSALARVPRAFRGAVDYGRVPWQVCPLRGQPCQPFARRLRLALTGRHWRTLPVGSRSTEPPGLCSAPQDTGRLRPVPARTLAAVEPPHLGRAHGRLGPFCACGIGAAE